MTQNNIWEERFSMEFPELYSLEQLDSIKKLNSSGGNFKPYPFQEKLKQFIRQEREAAKEEERDRIMNEPMTKAHWEKYEKEIREALLREIVEEIEDMKFSKKQESEEDWTPVSNFPVTYNQTLTEVHELIKKKI